MLLKSMAVALALLAGSAFSQISVAYTFNGDSAGDLFGGSVRVAGDVNGDGFADLIVGAYLDDNNGPDSGSARVFSGFDGSMLHTFNGDSAYDGFGNSVSGAGDVNGDGFADLIVGAYLDNNNGQFSGSARVFSGIDGSTLYAFRGDSAFDLFGSSVSSAGDVNGDGFADLIVGAFGDDNTGANSGSARVLSGFDGSTLYIFNGDSAGDYFGHSVSGAGDVNGDGFADVIVGAYFDSNNGQFSGSARVYSGFEGATLYTFNGDSGNDEFGISVSGAGDVNGDGFADLIVGAHLDDNNGQNTGSARVFSGVDGSTLYTFNGDSVGDQFGVSVSGAGDVNGDGFADLIVGAYLADTNAPDGGSARVFSGFDGSTLYTFDGDSISDNFGFSVSGAGDVNGDGFADLIVGAFLDDNNGTSSGSARVFLAPTRPNLTYRTTSTLPHLLDLDWLPDNNNPNAVTGTFACSGATPGSLGLAGVSFAPDDQIYSSVLPVLIDLAAPQFLGAVSFGFDLTGSFTAPGFSRQNPQLAGTYIYIQVMEASLFLTSSSPGIRLELAL